MPPFPESDPTEDPVNVGAAVDRAAFFCPAGSSYAERSCLTETEAIGPFTQDMVDRCIRYGGGEGDCRSDRWDRAFALELRGAGLCMAGASFSGGLCLEEDHAYGPFTNAHVDRCISAGGGASCRSMRWAASFARRTLPAEQVPHPLYFCPASTRFENGLCVTRSEAVGPFTAAMIERCVRFAGGVEDCRRGLWDRRFAEDLRGDGECMDGAALEGGLCVEGAEAYGPFEHELVERCLVAGGGEPCYSMRWDAAFARGLLDGESEGGPDWGAQFADNVAANASAYEREARGDISSGTHCVAFVCVGLRHHPDPERRFPDIYATVTEGPPSEACSAQLRCSLEARGFTGPHLDAHDLRRGDICFTQDTEPFAGEHWPNHAYIFYEWVTPGRTDYAYVLDQVVSRGVPYVRNMTVAGTYTPFQYFMRSPFQATP